MDAYDAFKKLSTGIKFDFSRFSNDARKFEMLKSKCPSVPLMTQTQMANIPVKKQETINTNDAKTSNAKKSKKKRIKPPKSKEKLMKIRREEVSSIRHRNNIHIYGQDVPDLFTSFDELCKDYSVPDAILKNVQKCGYEHPTPIQMQAVTIMIHRREILACAPTGSGKTAAFLIPIFHNLQRPENLGFRALILEPTRELAHQTYRECVRLSDGLGFRIHIIKNANRAVRQFGHKSKKFDILVSTPNRLIHLLKQEQPINLKTIQWLIVDEADKLFEEGKSGFRKQLAAIYKACDSSNICRAMFSATFSSDVEHWCKLNLDNVVTVTVGARNSAVATVEQELQFVGSEAGKLLALRNIIQKGIVPPVLVFVQSKERAKELFDELVYDGINVDVMHADKTELQRENLVKAFRTGLIWILICTDLMGRGIDFKGVNLVVNYDFPDSSISYIHRIGRTGRAGKSGKAITFFTEEDVENLRSIAHIMKNSGCPVPDYMLHLKKPSRKRKLVENSNGPAEKKSKTSENTVLIKKKHGKRTIRRKTSGDKKSKIKTGKSKPIIHKKNALKVPKNGIRKHEKRKRITKLSKKA